MKSNGESWVLNTVPIFKTLYILKTQEVDPQYIKIVLG